MDQKIAQLEKSKSEKTEQLVAATAGKMARVKYGHPVVVIAGDIEEYRSYESGFNRLRMK